MIKRIVVVMLVVYLVFLACDILRFNVYFDSLRSESVRVPERSSTHFKKLYEKHSFFGDSVRQLLTRNMSGEFYSSGPGFGVMATLSLIQANITFFSHPASERVDAFLGLRAKSTSALTERESIDFICSGVYGSHKRLHDKLETCRGFID